MKMWKAVTVRLIISLIFGMLGAWGISELSYQLLKDPNARDQARRIELVIPPGTAEKVAAGEPVLSLPEKMTFVEGDLLVVKNLDSVSHQLGPVWVPPQSSGVLEVGKANTYQYACTFQTSRLFGIEVKPNLTVETRIQGVVLMGLPSAAMLWLYSFLIFPIRSREEAVS